MRRLFKPFNSSNPDQCFWDVVHVMAWSCVVSVGIVLLVAGWAMWHPPKTERAAFQPYYSAEEYNRLQKKHGHQRVIIEEPGQVPYYYDAQGRKCKLM